MSYFMSSCEEGSISHPMFSVTVVGKRIKEIPSDLLSLFVTRERADIEARHLSRLLPHKQILLATRARCKAVYVAGERTKTFDYREFYDNLTDEQYKNTQFLCSETHQYV